MLSTQQRRQLAHDGYLQIKGLVSPAQIEHARRAINISIGRGMDKADMARLRVQSFCPELREASPLMNLLAHGPIRPIAESLIGKGQIRPGSQGAAQINLRFPIEEKDQLALEPHLDGMASRTNAVPTGQLRNFTALIGVMLSGQHDINQGNFTVWPGTHLMNAAYLRRAGPQSLIDAMPDIALPTPVQIKGDAGDVIISHYLLSHGTAPNLGADVRYMVFFRLTHVDHDEQRWESLCDPWLQWPGLRDVAPPLPADPARC